MLNNLTPAQVAELLAIQQSQQKRTLDDKVWTQESSRPLGTKIYFTSRGDNFNDKNNIGGGDFLKLTHSIGNAVTQDIVIDLNSESNKTYIHEGYVMWENADFDTLSLIIIPCVTTYTAGINTNYNLYGGYIVIPAAGNGTITPTNIQLVEMPISGDKGVRSTAFWNATWNKVTGQYENITPAPNGDGVFNMFTVEITLSRFVNDWLLLNNGFMMLQSAESEQLGAGMRLKLIIKTNGEDHDWKAAVGLVFHREQSC